MTEMKVTPQLFWIVNVVPLSPFEMDGRALARSGRALLSLR